MCICLFGRLSSVSVIMVTVQPYLVFYRCVSVVEQLMGRHIPSPNMAELGEVWTGLSFFFSFVSFFFAVGSHISFKMKNGPARDKMSLFLKSTF